MFPVGRGHIFVLTITFLPAHILHRIGLARSEDTRDRELDVHLPHANRVTREELAILPSGTGNMVPQRNRAVLLAVPRAAVVELVGERCGILCQP